MFSQKLQSFIHEEYTKRVPYLRAVQPDIDSVMYTGDADEGTLLRYFYATMPLRDAGAYPAALFAEYARHAVMLRRNVQWCKTLPEETFLHHVAYYRINSENIEACRGDFFAMLYPRVLGMGMEKAVLEINYWCGENVQYAASDMRTASPLTVYKSGIGRCGEESTFTVTALRSVGIPARQVYTPRWAHCDDNHAWVEVYIEGEWKYFGACEPEEVLNRGWFTAAAARAIMVYSRVFGSYEDYRDTPVAHKNLLCFYNSTAYYASTKTLEITLLNQQGSPVQGADVSLQIFNMAELVPVVSMVSGPQGKVRVDIGRGDVVAVGQKGEETCAVLVGAGQREITMVLQPQPLHAALATALAGTLDFTAPPAAKGNGAALTPEQKQRGMARRKQAATLREAKQQGLFHAALAEKYPQAGDLLAEARGNFTEIYTFLNGPNTELRMRMLRSISTKDLRDAKADVLEHHLQEALKLQHTARVGQDAAGQPVTGSLPEDIFDECLLCPRAGFEEMTEYRGFVQNYFTPVQRAEFFASPQAVAGWIEQNIGLLPQWDYPTIYTTPKAALVLQDANEPSRHILFVCICRGLGIPARLNPHTRLAEYYSNGGFTPAWQPAQAQQGGVLHLHTGTPAAMVYTTTWTIAAQTPEGFTTLDYTGSTFDEQGKLQLDLQPGVYRLITAARMPNGNQKVNTVFFTMEQGAEISQTLCLPQGELPDYFLCITLPELVLQNAEGGNFLAEEKFAGEKRVLMFLEEGAEPTEHVLNELLEKSDGGGLSFVPEFIVRSTEALQNATLQRVLRQIPGCRLYTADFDTQLEPLARQMFTDHEKLPVLLVTDTQFRGRFATSGYQVGSVDLLEKLLDAMVEDV